MICPVCSAEIDNNHLFCEFCGAKLEHDIKSDIVNQNKYTKPEKENKMIFNIIFSVILLWAGINSALSVFSSIMALFTSSFIVGLVGVFINLISGALFIATGIALLKKKRIGYVLSNVVNVLNSILSLLMSVCGGMLIYVGATDTSEYAALGYVLGVLFLVFAIPSFILHVIAFFYYKKNKHHFVN